MVTNFPCEYCAYSNDRYLRVLHTLKGQLPGVKKASW